MKILCVGDIHGRHELITEAFNTFITGKYDKIIFLGDYADSYDRTDSDILRCFNILLQMKKTYHEQVILLIGNHDEPYFHHDTQGYKCSGFRPTLHRSLSHVLIPQRTSFSYAHGISNFLFTHAGVSMDWYLKHFKTLSKWADRMEIDLTDVNDFWIVLNNISTTSSKYVLHEIGPDRGGTESEFGGPLWCDKEEILTRGPLIGLNQVVGHTSQHFITRVHVFEDNKRYENTSVTFIDCLSYRHQFLTLNIKGGA
jgi:predicted phosphodiesterase